MLLLVGVATQALLEFELQSVFGRRRMERDISRLSGHYILCGAGRVGRSAARELARKPAPFVVIESDPQKLGRYAAEGWLTDYRRCHAGEGPAPGAHRACARPGRRHHHRRHQHLHHLTARSLNPKLKIIARASEEDAEKHLTTAGADRVISPYNFAGYRIAQTFLRPNVVDFFDTAMTADTIPWRSRRCRCNKARGWRASRWKARAFARRWA